MLLATFVALWLAGCGDAQEETIDLDDNETRKRIIAEAIHDNKLKLKDSGWKCYAPNKQTPYTGWSKNMYDNGQIAMLIQWKDGRKNGLWTMWYSNGRKRYDQNYKKGKLMTTVGWLPNGEKCPKTNVKNGNGVRVFYLPDGSEGWRKTFKDGEEVSD